MIKVYSQHIPTTVFLNAYKIVSRRRAACVFLSSDDDVDDNTTILTAARFTWPADTLISIDNAPAESLGAAAPARRKPARKRPRKKPAPDMVECICDGKTYMRPRTTPQAVATRGILPAAVGAGNPIDEHIKRDLKETAARLNIPFSYAGFNAAYEAEQNAFRKEARDIERKQYKRLFGTT